MKMILALAITLLISSCASVSCPGDTQDGGIGGTGDCQQQDQIVKIV